MHSGSTQNDSRSDGEKLRLFTERSNAIHREYLGDPELLDRYRCFIAWQNGYMSQFYADFRATQVRAAAVDFVISDLTGIGISARDRDLARVVPLMTKMLPHSALRTLTVAMELNSRILQINVAICRELFKTIAAEGNITEREYCLACRRASRLDECLELVAITRQVGENLNQVIQLPMIGAILWGMRAPARLAGFGSLQEFLETGYRTFRAIDDVDRFLEEISARTTSVFTRIYQEPAGNLAAS